MFERSDEQLIAAYLGGEEKALELLFSRYLKTVYGFVYRYLGNRPDAEDVSQEVFIKVWKNLKKFDRTKNFKTWILSIARNSSLDFWRKKKGIPLSLIKGGEEAELAETVPDPAPLPPEIFARKNLSQELAAVLEKLSLAHRLVIFLHYQERLTFQEIAEILSESLNTVKSRHWRGLAKLKEWLTAPEMHQK